MKRVIAGAAIAATLIFSGCSVSNETAKNSTPKKVEKQQKALSHGELKIVSYEKAKGMFNARSALFIDARGGKLYKKGTILGSVNIPVKKFKRLKKKILPENKKAKIVTFCNGVKCEKSDELAVLLMKEGYTKVMVYKGGYPEWKEKKMPIASLIKKCK